MATADRSPKDLWSGIIFIILGVAAVYIGRDYPMGTGVRMGPGYFPTVLGALLALLGLALAIRSFFRTGEPLTPFVWREVLLVLGATVLFGVLVRNAGLVVALLVLVMMSAYASVKFRWGPSIALAVGMTVFSVLVFVWALGLPIPVRGPWLGG